MKAKLDNVAASKLMLWTKNNPILNRLHKSCTNYLDYKIQKNTFDFEKSIKLWEHFVDQAAKTYYLEHCSTSDNWYNVFNKTTRRFVAKEFANHYLCVNIKNE